MEARISLLGVLIESTGFAEGPGLKLCFYYLLPVKQHDMGLELATHLCDRVQKERFHWFRVLFSGKYSIQ